MLQNNFSNSIAYCEAKGISKCFLAYAEYVGMEDIMEIGFNCNSGYTYIALENTISICSAFGRDVEYLVTNFYNGEEFFFDSYEEAENKLENMNEEEEEEEEIEEEN
jgi:hypothetical protein